MRTCINVGGLNSYQRPVLTRASHMRHHTLTEEVTDDASQLRFEYCTFRCPVQQRCKFVNRYGGRR